MNSTIGIIINLIKSIEGVAHQIILLQLQVSPQKLLMLFSDIFGVRAESMLCE
jgi:hypothetical protein